ncbi:MAG: alanine racemase [Aquificota bacterium]|nr:alanine racemase [Aquificota bacterium]
MVAERSVLQIDREALVHNAREIFRFSGKGIIAVVKSDAYGIGARWVAPILEKLPEVKAFAVACPEEGVVLRELGVRKEILVLGGLLPGDLDAVKEYRLTPVVSDIEHLRVIGGEDVPFHIKYDTGMGRLGFVEETLEDPRIEGVMSHLSTPADREFSLLQIKRFSSIVKRYPQGVKVHMESSAGLVYRIPFTTHVRVGLALYGEKPLKNYPLNLKPAITLRARIVSVKDLPPDHPVSYGGTYVTRRRTRVGVVAFGYADGLMKTLSNVGTLIYKGKEVPIIGNITMDMTMVDLTGTGARVGDWVTVVGEGRTFGDLARTAGTIPYELMCNVSSRVLREVI